MFWYLSMWPWPRLKVSGMQERKQFCASYLWKFVMGMGEIAMLLRLVGLFNLILIISCHINIQGKDSNLSDFVPPKNWACIWAFSDQFLSNQVWWQTPLYCIVWYHCEWPWLLFNVTAIWESRNICAFSCRFLNWFGKHLVCWHALLVWPGSYQLIFLCDSCSRERAQFWCFWKGCA